FSARFQIFSRLQKKNAAHSRRVAAKYLPRRLHTRGATLNFKSIADLTRRPPERCALLHGIVATRKAALEADVIAVTRNDAGNVRASIVGRAMRGCHLRYGATDLAAAEVGRRGNEPALMVAERDRDSSCAG